MRAGSTACGACTSGSTAPPKAVTKRASGGATMTGTSSPEAEHRRQRQCATGRARGRWVIMSEPLLLSALFSSFLALPLSVLAIIRRRGDGWRYACTACLCPIFTFAIGGGLGLVSAASFRRGYLRDTPARSVDVAGMFTVLHEHYPELEPAARIALWTGGIAICAAFFAVFVIAWRLRGARRWVMVGLSAVASGMCIMTWRVAHLSERALSDAIDDGVRIALIQEIEQGCETLESTFAV